jgi:hypothetical protein
MHKEKIALLPTEDGEIAAPAKCVAVHNYI